MDNKIVVLFSGGWESCYCYIKAYQMYGKRNIAPVYVNYGESFQREEYEHACTIMEKEGKILHFMDIPSLPSKNGVYKGRNTQIMAAVASKYKQAQVIYFGGRNILQVFDKYGDASWQYGRCLGKALQIHIAMPCVLLPKDYIKFVVKDHGIPAKLVYSTEGMS